MAENTYTSASQVTDALKQSSDSYELVKKADSTNLVISWGSHYQDSFHRWSALTTQQFAGESYSNFDVLYLRDNAGLFYLNGLSGLGSSENFSDLAGYINTTIGSYSSGKVTHIGSREGGYAALLFACLANKNNSTVFAIHPTFNLTEVDSVVDDTGEANEWFNRVKNAEMYNDYKSLTLPLTSHAIPGFGGTITSSSVMDYGHNVDIKVGDTNTRTTEHTEFERPTKLPEDRPSKGEGTIHNNVLAKKTFISDVVSAGGTEVDGLDNNWSTQLQDLFGTSEE